MFDTVSYACFLALRASYGGAGLCPRGWKRTVFSNDADGPPTGMFDMILQHHLLGTRIFLRGEIVVKVEVDLPKLLHGHNSRLLATQSEVDTTLQRLKTSLQIFCEPLGESLGYFPGDNPCDTQTCYTRVDTVWQFDIAPGLVLLALRNAKHPEINKMTGHYAGETVHFPGTNIEVCIYDKKAKMRSSQEGNVMRVEVRYEDKKIAHHFGLGDRSLTCLDIDAAYVAYRSTLLQFRFTPVPDPSVKGTLEDYLAWVVTKLPDEDPIGTYCATKHMCRRKSRDLRKAVGNRVPSLVGFSWADLLPVDRLPPVVNMSWPLKEERVAELFHPEGGIAA